MKSSLDQSRLITSGIAFVISFLIANPSQAVINGCKNNATGVLRIAASCNINETPVSWDNVGPRGQPGLQGPPGPKGPIGPIGNPALPGATLNSLVADVSANLSEGPAITGVCSSNPYIMGFTPCPPVQSQCPFGTPIITKLSCTVLPSADSSKITEAFISAYGFDFLSDNTFKNGSASIDKTSNSVNCDVPATNFDVFSPPADVTGYTPWCFYKIGAGLHGRRYGFPPNSLVEIYYTKGNPIKVTEQQYNNPANWDCYPITIQAKAQCVNIPSNVKSLLQQFGK
jgi:hypothetical protein